MLFHKWLVWQCGLELYKDIVCTTSGTVLELSQCSKILAFVAFVLQCTLPHLGT